MFLVSVSCCPRLQATEQPEHSGVSDGKSEKEKGKNLGQSEVLVKMTPPLGIHKDPVHGFFVLARQHKKKKKKII